MTSANTVYGFQCKCGANHFQIKGEPAMRAVCHCHHCQEYNKAAYGDFVVYRKSQVEAMNESSLSYRSFSKPPMVKRGTCSSCGTPLMEKVNIPLLPDMLFVPVANHPNKAELPQPEMQMFTHRRIHNPGESIPSYSGYLGSEVPFVWKLIRGLWGQAN